MRNLVSNRNDVIRAVEDILTSNRNGFDSETYGKEFFDRMFALQIATASNTWYFNFHDYSKNTHEPSIRDDVPVLDKITTLGILQEAFEHEDIRWIAHNAKFDLRRLSLEGHHIKGQVQCTQSWAKMIYNQHIKYSLDECLKRIGHSKDDRVEQYIAEHKLTIGTGTGKKKFFHEVPFEIMFEYGCTDTEEARFLGLWQEEQIGTTVYALNDMDLQKAVLRMEEVGIVVRQDYAKGGLEYELEQKQKVAEQLSEMAGEPFRAGPVWLRGIFDKYGVPYSTNIKTGNPIFNKQALAKIDHPIAGLIREYRHHEKYASTYYEHFAKTELIHANVNLSTVDTGRFSYSEPNLQQVPKEEDLDPNAIYQVRGCFRPRSKDHCFVMVDFDQQEFRLLLDYAGEHDLIRAINDNGEDVHQATANMCGITRKQAKTVNFGLLYGMGIEELARMLGLPVKDATQLKELYFSKLPRVQKLIKEIIRRAKVRGYIETWVGRKLYVQPAHYDKDTGKRISYEYKMPNHLIQGGCGDIARFAIPPIDEVLQKYPKSNLLIQVHDELIFEIYKDDFEVIPQLVSIMENTYRPFNKMKLTCGVDHSWTSWGKRDVVKGYPNLITE